MKMRIETWGLRELKLSQFGTPHKKLAHSEKVLEFLIVSYAGLPTYYRETVLRRTIKQRISAYFFALYVAAASGISTQPRPRMGDLNLAAFAVTAEACLYSMGVRLPVIPFHKCRLELV